jgi:hypothetical protein
MARVLASSAPAAWGEEPDRPVEPVPPERLRPHFSNRTHWRTRGPRRAHRPAVVRTPERRENAARPRESRARRASTSSRASPGGSDPDEPPHLDRPLTRAQRDYLRAEIDKRRRELVAASDRAERSLEREWREAAV